MTFSFLSPFQLGSTLTGNNLLLWEQIVSFKGRSHFIRALSYSEANGKSEK